MFCKNARSKIAMASPDPDPALQMQLSSNLEGLSLGQKRKLDPSHILMSSHVDPAMQRLLSQQLLMCNPMTATQRQLQRQQQGTMAANDNALRYLLGNTGSRSIAPGSWLQAEIMAQKQQQARMQQLQQLMTLNLQRQQNGQPRSKNYRASAA